MKNCCVLFSLVLACPYALTSHSIDMNLLETVSESLGLQKLHIVCDVKASVLMKSAKSPIKVSSRPKLVSKMDAKDDNIVYCADHFLSNPEVCFSI